MIRNKPAYKPYTTLEAMGLLERYYAGTCLCHDAHKKIKCAIPEDIVRMASEVLINQAEEETSRKLNSST